MKKEDYEILPPQKQWEFIYKHRKNIFVEVDRDRWYFKGKNDIVYSIPFAHGDVGIAEILNAIGFFSATI